jgi:hypothetical protein
LGTKKQVFLGNQGKKAKSYFSFWKGKLKVSLLGKIEKIKFLLEDSGEITFSGEQFLI